MQWTTEKPIGLCAVLTQEAILNEEPPVIKTFMDDGWDGEDTTNDYQGAIYCKLPPVPTDLSGNFQLRERETCKPDKANVIIHGIKAAKLTQKQAQQLLDLFGPNGEHWGREYFKHNGKFCIIGACIELNIFSSWICPDDEYGFDFNRISQWNDAPERTFQDIQKLIKECTEIETA